MNLVFVVEDNQDLLSIEIKLLEDNGYRVRGFLDTISLWNGLGEETPDLILLDLTLPDRDGLDVCRDLKFDPILRAIPIIMVTGRLELDDIVKGLNLGADDYICKPFEQEELLARVRAILRRSAHLPQNGTVEIVPGLNLDIQRQELIDKGKRIILTLSEFRILQLLTTRPEWAFRRSEILDHLWGDDKIVVERTVDVHISNLREKLGSHATLIQKVHGVGYCFKAKKGNTGNEG
ncbi:MAG: response regulator transcription factor [Candidatus Cloacimonadaceae bacterium]|jgi:two-component system phosphate regulon response regulator PhoB/two-component system alkaline phosphatase synthesis response regulator PhoP|nr:response regulator transcription factor [Candidatus Cloacimonadota bacterium]MDX9949265.1 response regulator transcription factor [Candidatus Syntrophosphaera sp.]